jgi:GTPase SAR1 family protein
LQKEYGLLPRNQMRELLSREDYPSQQRRFLLDLMLKFELAFDLPDRQTLLIPDLISKEQPDFPWNEANALQFAYQYSILPYSILHRFMVRQHHRIDPLNRWHTGVMLHHDGFTALVKADIKAATIRIAIVSSSDSDSGGDGDRRQFLYSLRLEFASIHETISGTKPQEVVPIPGHPDVPPIGYAYLEQLEKMKMDTIPHAAPNGQVIMLNVQELLNGVSTSAMRQAGLPTRSQLLADLRRAFDESEFDELLFDLAIDEKDIGGDTTADRMREIIKYMERRDRIPDLVTAIGENRPYLDV